MKNQKPLILEIEEAKKETTDAINEILRKHKLPCYLFEPIIKKIYEQVVANSKQEINSLSSYYVNPKEEGNLGGEQNKS